MVIRETSKIKEKGKETRRGSQEAIEGQCRYRAAAIQLAARARTRDEDPAIEAEAADVPSTAAAADAEPEPECRNKAKHTGEAYWRYGRGSP